MSDEEKEKRIGEYDDRRCLICGVPYVRMIYISMHKKDFMLCASCEKELKERLK